jgi:hypothetical protein
MNDQPRQSAAHASVSPVPSGGAHHQTGHDADQATLAQLTLTYPAISITLETYGWRQPRWTAIRRHGTGPGLYAAITPNLSELHAILATSQPAQHNPHTALREPGPPSPTR